MADLYLIFFVSGVLLFGAIAVYSYLQTTSKPRTAKRAKQRIDRVAVEKTKTKSKATSTQSKSASVETMGETMGETIKGKDSLTEPGAIDQTTDREDSHDHSLVNTKRDQVRVASENSNAPVKASLTSGALNRAKAAIAGASRTKQKGKPDNVSSEASTPARKTEPSLDQPPPALSEQPPSGSSKLITSDGEKGSVVVDLVAKVMNPEPIEQSELLALFREHDFKFHRKVHIYGLNELTDMWRDIEFELPTARFLELGVSIQLCDREGAMSEKEAHDFQQMVLTFCDKYDAPFEFSMKIDEALQQAQTLDQIGRRYDCMAVLNVVPKAKSGFRIADIQSCARDLMMSSDKNGIFLKTEGQKNNITILYRLACTDGDGQFGIQMAGQKNAPPVHDLVVYMNVPATRDPETVFQQMVKDANDLATWLDGKVVDRTGKTMTQRTYTTLMQQISDIAYSMQQDGLIPGDAVAKKLF